jgi:hypothetical protein
MKRTAPVIAALIVAALVVPPAGARVKLVSVPDRAGVVLRLDHPEAVLVQEERSVTLQRGLNRLDFSWQRVGIEPGSIRLEPVERADRVEVLNVSYPPEENALVWEVEAAVAGPVRMRISYLLKGLRHMVSYRAVANADETAVALRGYLTLQNHSGERFEQVTIEPGFGASFVKQLEDGESKQMLSFAVEAVPVTKTFTYDPAQFGERVVMRYELANTAEHKLGTFALPSGKARLFIEAPASGPASPGSGPTFVGEDFVEFTPVGAELELLLGDARDIAVKQSVVEVKKVPRLREPDGRITLYDSDEAYRYEIDNFRDAPVVLTVVAHVEDAWQMVQASHPYERTDSRTVEFSVALPPKAQHLVLDYKVRRLNLQ